MKRVLKVYTLTLGVAADVQGFYNVVSPNPLAGQGVNLENEGNSWTLRFQLKFLFPKGR